MLHLVGNAIEYRIIGDSRIEACIFDGVAPLDLALQQAGSMVVSVLPSGPQDGSAICICNQRSSAVEKLLVLTER